MRYSPGVVQTTTSTTTSAIGQTMTLDAVAGRCTFAACSPITDEPFPVTIEDGTYLEMGWWKWNGSDVIERVGVLMTYDSNTETRANKPATGIAWGSGTKTVTMSNHSVDCLRQLGGTR